ncbi:MAG TPA: efflux RND transporter periplasmic adaptor subunit [Polyangium sp.]|nr:efflux RND transporter periplasmic adaptor subunit [Polyangium sp.]
MANPDSSLGSKELIQTSPTRGKDNPKEAAGRPELQKTLSRVEGKGLWLRRVIILLVLAGIIAGGVFWVKKNKPPPAARYVTTTTSTGDVLETIQSTGQVKPVTEVQIGAQVSGRITKVHVDFNSQVKAGDLLAEIDPQLIGAQIDENQARIAAAAASVKRAEANLETARIRLERARRVFQEGVGSQQELDSAQGNYDVAIADVASSKAQVSQISATLRSARTNYAFTKIYSPIDGIVINRAIDPGQTVAASFQTPTLFVIAQDLRKMRVLADIDEADVGRLKEAMKADIRVDAFPGETFQGVVSQVRYSPVNTSGVVTYAAVIEVENPDLKLRPGMTATATIHSADAKNAKRLPNAALRFKPSPPKDKDGKPIPQDPLPRLAPGKGRVYVLTNSKPGEEKYEMREVDIGITDGVNTVLMSDLGTAEIVTDETDEAMKEAGGRRRSF